MKKLDLIQLTLVIIGILIFYNSITYLVQFISYFLLWITQGLSGGYYLDSFIQVIIFLAAYLIAGIYLIKQSKPLSAFVCKKAELSSDINLAIDRNDLLFTFFILLGIYGLITSLPVLLRDSYLYFKAPDTFAQNDQSVSITGSGLFVKVFTVGLYFVLVYYAKVFANYLSCKINNGEPDDLIASKEND